MDDDAMRDYVQSLSASEISERIQELEGELEFWRVLHQAAKSREKVLPADKRKKPREQTVVKRSEPEQSPRERPVRPGRTPPVLNLGPSAGAVPAGHVPKGNQQ